MELYIILGLAAFAFATFTLVLGILAYLFSNYKLEQVQRPQEQEYLVELQALPNYDDGPPMFFPPAYACNDVEYCEVIKREIVDEWGLTF